MYVYASVRLFRLFVRAISRRLEQHRMFGGMFYVGGVDRYESEGN